MYFIPNTYDTISIAQNKDTRLLERIAQFVYLITECIQIDFYRNFPYCQVWKLANNGNPRNKELGYFREKNPGDL